VRSGKSGAAAWPFVAEVRSLAHVLGQTVGRTFQAGCDAALGDARCGIDLENAIYKGTGVVTDLLRDRAFMASGLIVTDDNPRGEDAAAIRAWCWPDAPHAARDRRPARSHRRRHRRGGARRYRADRGQGTRTGPDHRQRAMPCACCRSTTLPSRANVPGGRERRRMNAAPCGYSNGPADPADDAAAGAVGRASVAARGGGPSADFQISGVEIDSRDVVPGDLFFALKGEATDGHRFLEWRSPPGRGGAVVDRAMSTPARAGIRYHRRA
jgi:hypothetical protein